MFEKIGKLTSLKIRRELLIEMIKALQACIKPVVEDGVDSLQCDYITFHSEYGANVKLYTTENLELNKIVIQNTIAVLTKEMEEIDTLLKDIVLLL
jgi:hypothetical protein